MKKLYYFAYGSNMLSNRIEERVGWVKKVSNYTLKDWNLMFNCGHSTHSYANIVPLEGSKVEGVLYEVDEWQIDILDRCEGYPRNYEKRYFIVDEESIGFVYVSVSRYFTSDAKPTLEYMNLLLDGALQNDLEETFNKLVAYKNEMFDLPLGNKHKFTSPESRAKYKRQLNSYYNKHYRRKKESEFIRYF